MVDCLRLESAALENYNEVIFDEFSQSNPSFAWRITIHEVTIHAVKQSNPSLTTLIKTLWQK
jgi:hypothetical protein